MGCLKNRKVIIMVNIEEKTRALQEPFKADRVVWRVQQAGLSKQGKPWAMVLAYMDNRAVQERFDEVFGINGWKNEFKTAPDGGTLCGISVKFDGEWVTKWDGAENTQVEAVKGGLSGSMKRAAVQWGVGRYLYDLETTFAECSLEKQTGWQKAKAKGQGGKDTRFYWKAPQLPAWALPQSVRKKENTEQLQPPKVYVVGKDNKEFDEAKLKVVVEKMVGIAGKSYGATIEEQKEWLSMPLDEAYSDIENFVEVKKEFKK